MRNSYFLAVLLLASCSVYAQNITYQQDIIYLTKGKTEPGIVKAITSDKVKYVSENSSNAVKNIKNENVVLLFNIYGDYLKFNSDGGRDFSNADVEDFIHKSPVRHNDLIFSKQAVIYAVKLISVKDDTTTAIFKGSELKIPTSSIAVVIKQDGSHHLFTTADQAARCLPIKDSIQKYLMLPPEVLAAKKAESATIRKDGPKIKNPIDEKLMGTKANQEVTDLTNYIKRIVDPSTSREIINKSIDLACGLFVNEDARVEVSSLNSPIRKKFKVRTYLNHLANSVNYDKIDIDYVIVGYSPTLAKGTDGNYYGTITMVQTFKGYKDGIAIYADKTTRFINFVVKKQTTTVETGYAYNWEVLLTDMGVKETEKLN